MRSRASVKSHPLHPILIAFPIAFLVGGLVADIAGALGRWGGAPTVGASLSIAGGLVCCPWHGSQFHVKDGTVAAGPAKEPIVMHEVTEEGGKVSLVVKK